MLTVRFRILLALTLAAGALSATAGPSAAYLGTCSGTCGYFEPGDSNPPISVVCVIESASRDLDKIKVTPPLVYGRLQRSTPVRWRFKVQRRPLTGGLFRTVYKSMWQGSTANANDPAYQGYGFSVRTWNAPENPAQGWYRVRLEIQWKRNGVVEGTAAGVYDWSLYVRNGSGTAVSGPCLEPPTDRSRRANVICENAPPATGRAMVGAIWRGNFIV